VIKNNSKTIIPTPNVIVNSIKVNLFETFDKINLMNLINA